VVTRPIREVEDEVPITAPVIAETCDEHFAAATPMPIASAIIEVPVAGDGVPSDASAAINPLADVGDEPNAADAALAPSARKDHTESRRFALLLKSFSNLPNDMRAVESDDAIFILISLGGNFPVATSRNESTKAVSLESIG